MSKFIVCVPLVIVGKFFTSVYLKVPSIVTVHTVDFTVVPADILLTVSYTHLTLPTIYSV